MGICAVATTISAVARLRLMNGKPLRRLHHAGQAVSLNDAVRLRSHHW